MLTPHPQLTSCGPIEARKTVMSVRPGGRIRSSRAAAPLKQRRDRLLRSATDASAAHELRPH